MILSIRRFLSVAALLCAVMVSVTGCSKIKNENPVIRERNSFLFFNYTIPGPTTELPKMFHQEVAQQTRYEGMTLRVSCPEDYLPTTVIAAFQDETAAFVEIVPVRSDLSLFRQISEGTAGDLILAPDYLVEQLILEKKLQTLNLHFLPNLTGIDSIFQRPRYDPIGAFSLPYDWTVEGIAYDSELVDVPPQSWSNFFYPDPENLPDVTGHMALPESSHQSFASALLYLKKSLDFEDETELKKAAAYLEERIDTLGIRLLSGVQMEQFTQQDVILAQTNSGIAARAQALDSDILFVAPEEGTWITVNNFVIPSSTSPDNKELAQVFANFLLRPRMAALVVDHSLRASTITASLPYIEPQVRLGPSYINPTKPVLDYRRHHTEKSAVLRADLWSEIIRKIDKKRSDSGLPPLSSSGSLQLPAPVPTQTE